jgi:hypothetical protein
VQLILTCEFAVAELQLVPRHTVLTVTAWPMSSRALGCNGFIHSLV